MLAEVSTVVKAFVEAERIQHRLKRMRVLEKSYAAYVRDYLAFQVDTVIGMLVPKAEPLQESRVTIEYDEQTFRDAGFDNDQDWMEYVTEQAWDRGESGPTFRRVSNAYRAEAMLTGGDEGIDQADPDHEYDISFSLKNPRAVDYLYNSRQERFDGIDQTTRVQISRILADAASAGVPYAEVGKLLKKRFTELSKSRAELIAVTELGDAYAEGSMEAARQLRDSGLVMQKRWLTSKDTMVTPGCRANEAAGWIGVDEGFPSGHQRPLRFPGCRCDIELRRDKEASIPPPSKPVVAPPPMKTPPPEPDDVPAFPVSWTGADIETYFYNDSRPTVAKMFNRDIDDDFVRRLIGAPDGSEITITASGDRRTIQSFTDLPADLYVEFLVEGKHINTMQRTYYRDMNTGELVVHNDELSLAKDAPKGMGTRILYRQVVESSAAGVTRIDTHAAGSKKDYKYNGYYTWPRLGYDGDIPDKARDKLPKEYASAVTVRDLFMLEGGAEWWKENGSAFDASFSLEPGSVSMEILEEYARRKGITNA